MIIIFQSSRTFQWWGRHHVSDKARKFGDERADMLNTFYSMHVASLFFKPWRLKILISWVGNPQSKLTGTNMPVTREWTSRLQTLTSLLWCRPNRPKPPKPCVPRVSSFKIIHCPEVTKPYQSSKAQYMGPKDHKNISLTDCPNAQSAQIINFLGLGRLGGSVG